jgi:hypothetical protein
MVNGEHNMNKAQLIAFVQSLPDDLCVQPLELTEAASRKGPWERMEGEQQLSNVYRRDVDNTLTIQLDFKTTYQGEFQRTYSQPDGVFTNLKRVR